MISIKINETPINISTNTKDVTFKVYFKVPQTPSDECYGNAASERVITTTPIISGDIGNLNLINVVSPTINYTLPTNLGVWLDFSMTIDETDIIGDINIFLQLNGESDCKCDYEVLIKDVEIIETTEIPNITTIPLIGFNQNVLGDETLDGIQKVIDNKKSWVYNPGTPKYGIKEYDGITRAHGDRGLIDGFGNLNRKFSPSEDAELLYRTTNYLDQSSTLEKHSNLVINSKELFMTFNMSPKLVGTSGQTYASLINLETYKKTFQSFWIKLTEQFVPATAIFVSAEKWFNGPDEICETINECDLDNELTSADITSFISSEAQMSFSFNENTCIGCKGSGAELEKIIIEGDTVFGDSGTTKDNSIDKTIYFDGFALISLEEDLTNAVVTTGPLTIDDLLEKKSGMNIYRGGLNIIEEKTIFE